jgi:hypothetical protein
MPAAATGGTITLGTYSLSTETVYANASVCSIAMGMSVAWTIALGATTGQFAETVTGTTVHDTFSYSTSGTNFVLTSHCLGADTTMPYTATANTLTLVQIEPGSGVTVVHVFQLR